MFKHILLPTDGSAMSEMASQKCIALAREAGAQLSVIHVIPEFHVFAYAPEMVTDTPEQYKQFGEVSAKKILGGIESATREAGVSCATQFVASDWPYEAIIKAAKERGCDLICMASHGRKGVKGALLGSETHKVLTHTDIPVLVYR
jgi:nucleotide-binding universal stress UspA family protein